MRIKLLHDIPVLPTHGLTEGRIMETVSSYKDGLRCVWVKGDEGKDIMLFAREYEEVEENGKMV